MDYNKVVTMEESKQLLLTLNEHFDTLNEQFITLEQKSDMLTRQLNALFN